MRRSVSLIAAAAVGMAVATVFDFSQWVSAQQRPASRFAAVPGEKGGQDIFGAYEVVPGWPKDLSKMPGNEGWTFGAGQSVFAESPNGCSCSSAAMLPAMERPMVQEDRAEHRLPDRPAAVARCDRGEPARQRRHRWQLAEAGIEVWLKAGNQWASTAVGALPSWYSTLRATSLESWMQWDKMLQRPHFIAISPYDAQKHVWLIDDHKHVIFKMTQRRQADRADDRHLWRARRRRQALQPPDLHGLVPRRQLRRRRRLQRHARRQVRQGRQVRHGVGREGQQPATTRGPASSTTCTASPIDPKTRRIFVNDRGNHRVAGLRRERQVPGSVELGDRIPPTSTCSTSSATAISGPSIAAPARCSSTTSTATSMYSWGTWGDFPGGMWGVHGFSVDSDGNVYTASVDAGGAQKLRPRKGANPASCSASRCA